MTLSNKYRKDFETWVNEGHNSNPSMLKREPEDKDSYATSSVQLAWECYQNFVVEPDKTDETRVVTQEEHQEGCAQMIVYFMQQMKRVYGMQVKQDEEGCVVVYNPDTGYLKRCKVPK
jgi:hypothetical protein